MRLLHSTSFELHEFLNEDDLPEYAILSHTWGLDEVSLQEMLDIQRRGEVVQKAGYLKILGCCKIAAVEQFQYVWIDTCCIDKTSSQELSEAINSMYRWYQKAARCYAYLADVSAEKLLDLQYSRWFTRGWTLQELIAPRDVAFYSAEWQFIGTREDLKDGISKVTGIDIRVLSKNINPRSTSVAKRMSWASKRVTTRLEDVAYCLLGLFGVNMPLLYGEGERAFQRLQEEIIKISSDDHSLFAWRRILDPGDVLCGLLAKSPAEFAGSADIALTSNGIVTSPYSITSQGILIELMLLPVPHRRDTYVAPLNCIDAGAAHHRGPVAIYLKRLWDNQFAREYPSQMATVGTRVAYQSTFVLSGAIYVKSQLFNAAIQERIVHPGYWFHIPEVKTPTGYRETGFCPESSWRPNVRILELTRQPIGVAGAILFEHPNPRSRRPFAVIIAVDCNLCVSVRVEEASDSRLAYDINQQRLQHDRQGHSRFPPSSSLGSTQFSYQNKDEEVIGGARVKVQVKEETLVLESSPHEVFSVHILISDSVPGQIPWY